MQYFLLGLGALALLMLAVRGFTQANPAALAQVSRTIGGVILLGLAVVLLLRGGLGYATLAGTAGLWLLANQRASPFGGASRGPADRMSRVATAHIEMELEHASGAMRGRVLSGRHAGQELDDLKPVDLVGLWQDYRFSDPASAQLVEAYLDRSHASWRDDYARTADDRAHEPSASSAGMSREEAFQILGLPAGADEAAIRRAHRDLMLKVHPDRGGSSFLAAKINQAKDVLLGRG